jgi:DNA-binding GntR family transcriptional regulator
LRELIGEKLPDQLREMIEERVLTGFYRPGMRLDELELAASFGVSRTPIREAFIQLASAGVIEIRPRRGAIVSQIAPERLKEMFEVMAELEAMCARLAAGAITATERTELSQAHLACQGALASDDPDAYYHLNEAFHQAIYRFSHNGFLEEQTLQVLRRLRPFRRMQLHLPRQVEASFVEHGQVLDAILAGDAASAALCLRHHVGIQGDRFANLLAMLAQERDGSPVS